MLFMYLKAFVFNSIKPLKKGVLNAIPFFIKNVSENRMLLY